MPDSYADHLYKRLFRLWELPGSEHEAGREDWCRVNAIASLRWQGRVLDVGCGDGTLGAMVASRNPAVSRLDGYDSDANQVRAARVRWKSWPQVAFNHMLRWEPKDHTYDGLMLCEVLEHLDPEVGDELLDRIRPTLRPGALVCITVPHANGARAVFSGHVRLFHQAPMDEMERLGKFAAIEVQTIDAPEPDDPYHMVPVWWIVVGELL